MCSDALSTLYCFLQIFFFFVYSEKLILVCFVPDFVPPSHPQVTTLKSVESFVLNIESEFISQI